MGRGVFFFGVGVEVGERVRRWKGGTSHPLPEPPLLLQGGRPLPRRALGERGGGGEGGRGAACPSPHGPGSLGMPARCGPLGHQEPLSRGQEEQAPARRAVVAAARRLPHKERQAGPLSAPHVHRHTAFTHSHGLYEQAHTKHSLRSTNTNGTAKASPVPKRHRPANPELTSNVFKIDQAQTSTSDREVYYPGSPEIS